MLGGHYFDFPLDQFPADGVFPGHFEGDEAVLRDEDDGLPFLCRQLRTATGLVVTTPR